MGSSVCEGDGAAPVVDDGGAPVVDDGGTMIPVDEVLGHAAVVIGADGVGENLLPTPVAMDEVTTGAVELETILDDGTGADESDVEGTDPPLPTPPLSPN